MRTEVAIIGAGPAGLLLGHLLRAAGIRCVIVEHRSADYVLGRIRAGVLETITTNVMRRLGLGQRMDAEGLVETAVNLANGERLIRIDFERLTGQHMTVYGQTELTRDLMQAAGERDLHILYEAGDVAIHGADSDAPALTCTHDGRPLRIEAQFIAGCDGAHGPSHRALPARARRVEMEYPFGWLGIMADVPPCHPELIYARSNRGFALASMRSRTRSRYYIQVPLNEQVEDWPEARLWAELEQRFNPISRDGVTRGAALDISIAPLRSSVSEIMRHGRLFLAGDAAHIVPPTGAKGLNLAVSDVIYLAEALERFFRRNDEQALQQYEARTLARVWQAERFSWSLTRLMHHFPTDTPFERRMQAAELDYIAASSAMQTAIAENYVGLPLGSVS